MITKQNESKIPSSKQIFLFFDKFLKAIFQPQLYKIGPKLQCSIQLVPSIENGTSEKYLY